MASSSSSTPPSSFGSKSSRFSTLKVFKFGSNKDREGKAPPPPPPKDHYYLQNRSMMSLSPVSQPGTPSSSMYPNAPFARKPFHGNGSAVSLVSTSATSTMSYNPDTGSHSSRAGSFFRFGRRTPRSPSIKSSMSTADDMHSTHQESDEGISLPWNFQHNLHVDEGMSQLPPSWLAELRDRGFSPEEIATINQKRLASQQAQASLNSITSDRCYSPALNIPRTDSPSPMLPCPAPRSTSLPRQFSQSSISSAQSRSIIASAVTSSPQSSVASLPASSGASHSGAHDSPRGTRPGYLPTESGHSQQPSMSSLSMSISAESSAASSYTGSGQATMNGRGHMAKTGVNPPTPVIYINESSPMKPSRPPPPSPPASQVGRDAYSQAGWSPSSRPSTPPRRTTFRVANASPPSPTGSPPPSYTPSAEHFPSDEKGPSLLASSSTTTRPNPSDGEESLTPTGSPAARELRPPLLESPPSTDSVTSTRSAKRRSKRFSAAPPRLSIHEDSFGGFGLGLGLGLGDDLSSWSQSLLSSIPDTGSPSSSTSGATPTSATHATASTGAASSKQMSSSGTPSLTIDVADCTTTSKTLPRAPSRTALGQVQEEDEPRTFSGDWEDHRATILWSESGSQGKLREAASSPSEADPPAQTPHSLTSPTSLSPPRDRASAYRIGPDGKMVAEQDDSTYYGEEDDSLLVTGDRENRFSSQSVASTMSTSTITAHVLPTTITQASVARRVVANMIDGPTPKSPPAPLTLTKLPGELPSPQPSPPARASPMSSTFGSSEGSSSSSSQEYPPPVTDLDGVYYLDPSDARKQAYLPSPTASSFSSNRDSGSSGAVEVPLRPKIIVSDIPVASTLPTSSPMTAGPPPASPRYSGWLAEAVSPLSDFIDEAVDPRATYVDLQEIAEGESGSVFAAVLVEKYADQLRLPLTVRARDKEDRVAGRRTLVAIKQVAVSPEGSQKMKDLRHELHLLRGLAHENILSMDALYVDAVDDYLWIRMDLMERSLADVIELVNDGLMLQERMVARFATDILLGLDYIHKQGIAHRDVRSDNLLINNAGLVRLTDFSNAVKVTPEAPTSSEVVGVIYWQAPEMRIGPYNPLKADIWSLGATTWEAAQAEPPFVESQQIGDRWPSVRQPELFSPAFHEFLRLCSEPAAARPDTATLLKSSFTGNACGRAVIVQLLSQCMSIERRVQEESGEEES